MNLDTAGEYRSALINLRGRLNEPGGGRRSEALRPGVTMEQVEAALQRLEQGTYGVCRGCFLVIPRGELLKRPYAERCGRCQARSSGGGGLR